MHHKSNTPVRRASTIATWSKWTVLIGAMVLMLGCDIQLGPCPDWDRNAIEVSVFDSATGLPAALGATGWVQDGSYTDSLVVAGWQVGGDSTTAYRMVAAMERPGRYDVFINKTGYAPWERRNVRVVKRSCGVEPAQLNATLISLSASEIGARTDSE